VDITELERQVSTSTPFALQFLSVGCAGTTSRTEVALPSAHHEGNASRMRTSGISWAYAGTQQALPKLEMRCSLTAKQNSNGKRQWFIGYKARTTVGRTNSELKDGFKV